jgi:catechol 2,3-dioxygenase-like lactoylglutathione lyase family enzyme
MKTEDEDDFDFKNPRNPRNLQFQMNIAFEHLAIPSPNPVALRSWYERVLGAREIFNNGQNPPTLLIALPGGGWFEIYAATGTPTPEDRGNNNLAGFRHVALRVDSIDAAKAKTRKAGREIHGRSTSGGGRRAASVLRGLRGKSAASGRTPNGFQIVVGAEVTRLISFSPAN